MTLFGAELQLRLVFEVFDITIIYSNFLSVTDYDDDSVEKATGALSQELSQIAHCWIHVGVLLGVRFSWLEKRSSEQSDSQQNLHDTLSHWLNSSDDVTLQRLVEAIEHKAGGNYPILAKRIIDWYKDWVVKCASQCEQSFPSKSIMMGLHE